MATFIGQLIGFALIVFIIVKYVVPPVRTLMRERQELVRTQLAESAKAAQRLVDADRYLAERVEEGRVEARHIVDDASSDSVRIAEQLRRQAAVESERILVQGDQQVTLLRAQTIRDLRARLGAQALERATTIVRERVANPAERSATIDRFLDELDAMAPVASAPQITVSDLRPASRDAQAAVVARFDSLAASLSTDDLSRVSAELTAVDAMFLREPILLRHLTEASGAAAAKTSLLERLLSGKVSPASMDILTAAVSARWSATRDLAHCVEHVARLCLLERAARENQADEVSEQLFRFSQILDVQPRLSGLLSDRSEPAAGRVSLLTGVLASAGGVLPTVSALLAQTVELLDGQRCDEAVQELARLAVARQGEITAIVASASELSSAQRERVTAVLSRIYRHPVAVHLVLDPALLGGLMVTVGDEVIDGTLSSRLAAAATRLPD